MRTIDYKGTNQYQRRVNRVFGLKAKTWRDINIVSVAILMVGFFGHQNALKDLDLHRHLISPLSMTAYAQEAPEYKEPELAPITERTQVIALIKKIWGRDADTGLAIARCESGYRINAVNHNTNGTIDQSVFQVNSVHNMPDMMNPTANILYAYGIYRDQGTDPWLSSAHCWKGML